MLGGRNNVADRNLIRCNGERLFGQFPLSIDEFWKQCHHVTSTVMTVCAEFQRRRQSGQRILPSVLRLNLSWKPALRRYHVADDQQPDC
jgi:hypothetical protein